MSIQDRCTGGHDATSREYRLQKDALVLVRVYCKGLTDRTIPPACRAATRAD